MQTYEIRRTPRPPCGAARWNAPVWQGAATAAVAEFRPEGSDHRPRTEARVLCDGGHLYGIFHVADRYVRCRHTRFLDPVCTDSCVEFFVQPAPDRGYFNFEFNCGGAFLASYVTDPARTPEGFREFVRLSPDDAGTLHVMSSAPPVVEPEIAVPLDWTLEFAIPFALFTKYAGCPAPCAGDEWRGNFYKCGDETSHPHWAAWAPVDELNFHLPRCFGALRFL